MDWFRHTLRVARRRLTWEATTFWATAVIALVALTQLGVLGWLGDEDDPSSERSGFASEVYATELLDDVGTSPQQFVDDLVATLVPGVDLSEAESAALVEELAGVLRVERGDGTTVAALVDDIVRRLGLDAADVGDDEALIALVLAEVDPGGTVRTATDLIAAFEAWAQSSSSGVLRLVAADGSLGLADSTFETATAALLAVGSGSAVDVGLSGVVGFDAIDVPGFSIDVDEGRRSILVSGTVDAFGGTNEMLVALLWRAQDRPTVLAAVRTTGWRLDRAGFTGDLGAATLPAATFLLADRQQLLTPGIGDRLYRELTRDHQPALGELLVTPGVNVLATLDGDALPASVDDLVGVTDGRLGLRGSLGPDLGVADGSSRPPSATIAVTADDVRPPGLPDWLEPSADPWALTLTVAGGEVEIGFEGGVEAMLDGAPRPFLARVAATSGGGEATGTVTAQLRSPWEAPFGATWLRFDELSMTVDVSGGGGLARFESVATVADRTARIEFEIEAGGPPASVMLRAAVDRITAADAALLVEQITGAPAPSDLPDLAIDDVLAEIRVGQGASASIGGRSELGGRAVELLVAAEAPTPGTSGVIIGAAFDSMRLGNVDPQVEGTLVGDLTFPPTALVLSTIDATVATSALSAPTQRFLRSAAAGEQVRLSSGLAMFSELDLGGTSLEGPLEALGYSGGRFPITGTIPGSAIGVGGGGSGLADLALRLQLPDIPRSGLPEWFRGGSLALTIDGRPSVGLEGEMTLAIDGEELTFIVGAEFAKTALGADLAVFGQLQTQRPWESPFGVDWLTVNSLALELSLDAVGTVGLGFAGDVVVAGKDFDGAIGIEVTAAGVPTNLILRASSAEGLALSELLAIQANIGGGGLIDASAYPDLALRDVDILFARESSPRLGVEAGFALAGDAYAAVGGGAAQRFASLDMRIDEQGISADGRLAGYRLGPLEWSDIVLDLELTRSSQHFIFDGRVAFLGASVGASVDLNLDSIFFAGRAALDDLRRIIEAFEAVLRDPAGSIRQVPEILEDAGVPLTAWMRDFFDTVDDVVGDGRQLTEVVIDAILNGGSVSFQPIPRNGADTVCPALQPLSDGGRCYTTLQLVSEGVPEGGVAPRCPVTAPRPSGGRCWRTLPSSTSVCVSYNLRLQCTKRETVTVAGTPSGGRSTTCGVRIEVRGRCYTIPPGEIIPATPSGGVAPICPLTAPAEEDGRCYTLTPSDAAAGLGFPGICRQYADVECELRDLVRSNLLPLVVERLVDRFDRW